MGNTKSKKTIYRNSVTGRFITKEYADKHPETTERQHVDTGERQKKNKK